MSRLFLTIGVAAIAAILAQPAVFAQRQTDATDTPPRDGQTAQSDQSRDHQGAQDSSNTDLDGESGDRRSSSDLQQSNDASLNHADVQSQNRPSSNQTRQSFSNESRPNNQRGREQSYIGRNSQERGERFSDYRRGVQFGEASDRGLTITNVERNSIYYDSGIRQNDLIVSVDGRRVRNDRDFYGFVRPGARVPVIVLRDGRQETVYITYDQDNYQGDRQSSGYGQSPGSQAYLGVRFEGRVRDGAVVSSVISGSPADEAGLQRGDEIVAINGREVRSSQEVTRIVASMQPGETVDIDFSRRIDERTQAVLEGREGSSVSSTSEHRQEVYRGGPQYDEADGRQFDPSYQNESRPGFENPNRGYSDGSERRNTRTLLPRLRN